MKTWGVVTDRDIEGYTCSTLDKKARANNRVWKWTQCQWQHTEALSETRTKGHRAEPELVPPINTVQGSSVTAGVR